MWCSTRWRAELIGLLFLGWVGSALANTSAVGVASAATGHAQLAGSRLLGQSTLRFFGLRIYHAQLWTMPDFRPGSALEQPLVLDLQYLRDLSGQAIAERSLQEMRRGGGFTEAQGQQWLAQMQRLFPDVRTGDRISGLHLPGQGARFWRNGQALGRIDDAAFSRLFFGIWLAPSTSEPEMRMALLGQDAAGQR